METTFTLPRLLRRDGQIAKIGRFLALLKQDKAWRITVEEAKSTRSIQQCRFLNGVLYKALIDKTGYERDDISDYCCSLYWGEREKRVPRSTNYPKGIKMVPCRTTTTDENGKRDVLKWDAFSDYVAF